MMTKKINGNLKAPFFITILLLALWGCGSGGGGGNGGGSNESIGSGDIGNGGSEIGDNDGSGNSEPGSGQSTDNSMTLAWDRPTTNSDGSELIDLAGFKIYYGTSSNAYSQSIDVGNITSAVISSLSSGSWCFTTTAYDTAGNESGYSNEICTIL